MSLYPVLVDAVLDRLQRRPLLAGVNLLDYEPVVDSDLRTNDGGLEAIWISSATGAESVEVIAGPDSIRFTERLTVPVTILVVGTDRGDDARRTRARCGVLVAEVKAVLSAQNTWPEVVIGFDVWDEWRVLPGAVQWRNGRVEAPAGQFGASCQLDLSTVARRTYT